jgi:excisionase family DNA binding protein
VNDVTTPDRPLTLNEAAEYLQLPPRAVRELCTRRKLSHSKLDYRNYRFRRADLDAYLDKHTIVASGVFTR